MFSLIDMHGFRKEYLDALTKKEGAKQAVEAL